jgi:hypothetical protein
MDNKVVNEINEWLTSNGETIPLGTLCWRTFAMVAYLPDTATAGKLRTDNDLGFAYAIGYQSGHITEIQDSGKIIVVSAYNNIKQYLRKNPIQVSEVTNGSKN